MQFSTRDNQTFGRLTRYHIAVVATVLLCLIMDGLDIQLLSFATPLIVAEWGVSKAQFSPVAAGAAIGMVVGTGLGGFLGDRLGRRLVFVLSVALFGAFTALASQSQGSLSLLAVRVASGIAFGAAYPNGIALVTDWLPENARSRAVGILATSAPLGGTIGAAASFLLLGPLGWRNMFLVCGLSTIVVGVLAATILRETPDWTKLSKRRSADQSRGANSAATDVVSEADAALVEAPVTTIFTKDNIRLNIAAPLCFFGFAFVNYSVLSWMPTILTSIGYDVQFAVTASLLYNAFAVVATLTASYLIGRLGSRPVLLGASLASLLLVVLIGLCLHGARTDNNFQDVFSFATIGTVGLLGAAHSFGFTCLFAIFAAGYAPAVRSTGIGFGIMVGRSGGVLAIVTSGILLTIGGDNPTVLFVTLSALSAVAGVAAFSIDRHCLPVYLRV